MAENKDIDEFLDEPWDDEMERDYQPANKLAMEPLATPPARQNGKPMPPGKYTNEEWEALLWKQEIPESKEEAKRWHNLAHRLTYNIRRADINKMPIKERIAAAAVCFDKRQLLLDKPTANINFQAQRQYADVAGALYQEIERRKRERATIDITPNEGDGE